MAKWKFYFDESYHDRSITAKKERLNIFMENQSDVYIAAIIGLRSDYESES